MAPKVLNCLLSVFLVSVSIPHFTLATSSSPITSIKHLQGGRKGETVKGLHTVKSYLQRFGYLGNNTSQIARANDDNFDDELEAALKTYQLNYDLKPTGVLDADTASKMAMPRCGVPDISNGKNHMLASRNKNLHTVSRYKFFGKQYIWPPSKKQLTYKFYQKVRPQVKTCVAGAFKKWASASGYFKFSTVDAAKKADLTIGFERRNHGDGDAFDGPGGTLAHAFAPTDGKFHYDVEEKWSAGARPGRFDLESLAVHEIGHLLGLQHSHLLNAIITRFFPLELLRDCMPMTSRGLKPYTTLRDKYLNQSSRF